MQFLQFPLMFTIFLLLNLNYTILRSLRNTLAVVDLGSGAHAIPLFELLAAMPGAFLMTFCLAWLMRRFSIQKVFILTLLAFLSFFFCFSTVIYPSLSVLKQGSFLAQTASMVFYAMSELWKPALSIILFWGLVNQYVPLQEAKKLYAPLMLGGSLGSIIAGPLISLCTSETIWLLFPLSSQKWTHSLALMILLIVFIGILAGLLYLRLWKFLTQNSQKIENTSATNSAPNDISFINSLKTTLQNSQLRLLSWIVIADYIAYGLGEVIFLDLLKLRFPEPADYCQYMGYLSLGSGIMTCLSSLFIAPFILQRCRWVTASLMTPICLLVTEGLFFIVLRANTGSSLWWGWTHSQWLAIAILLGSIQYCLCRGAKYTLFDSSKEIAFVLMDESQKIKGKLIVDGLCARIGRGSSSLLSIALISLSGGVIASSFVTGLCALGITASWVISTCQLGRLIEKKQRV